MKYPYGYFPGTVAEDGDSVDVFLGPNPDASKVWVISQQNPDTKKFVQPKTFLGFETPADVLDAFQSFYADGRGNERLRNGTMMSVQQFGDWLEKRRRFPARAV